ncbi:shikimate dehydrogenase [Niabella terrae]
MRLFGLIGMPLSQSFSKKYFTEKFAQAGISDTVYELFPLDAITQLPALLEQYPHLEGLNVTIPYKEKVRAYLDSEDAPAAAIGAVNCIKIEAGRLKGYNTDAPAFRHSLLPLLQPHHSRALILGTGGAAKAVHWVLQEMGIETAYVSRSPDKGYTYTQLDAGLMAAHTLIINCTPLGSFPKTETAPPIPYELLTARHYLYDLVYNPAETLFLKRGAVQGAAVKNGYEMLAGQAELSWEIWNTATGPGSRS